MKTFRTFYSAYKEKLFAYLMRTTGDYHLSCDVMQESFTRFLARYGPDAPNGALLFAIARNAALDEARKRKRFKVMEDDEGDDTRNQEQHLLVRESYREVLAAMEGLSKSERDILALVASSDLSYREIANMTGISEVNVKVKVHRARTKLKRILQMGDQQ